METRLYADDLRPEESGVRMSFPKSPTRLSECPCFSRISKYIILALTVGGPCYLFLYN